MHSLMLNWSLGLKQRVQLHGLQRVQDELGYLLEEIILGIAHFYAYLRVKSIVLPAFMSSVRGQKGV